MASYKELVVNELKRSGACKQYIEDWIYVYDNTGIDMRDLADGMDVEAFVEAYEEGDFEAMMMLS